MKTAIPADRMPFPRAAPVPAGSRYRYATRSYRILFGLFDAACAPVFRLARAITPRRVVTEPRAILLVQLDHIGDAVLTTPMLRALRQKFPAANIDVLASQSNREIFQSSPHVRHVYVSGSNWLTRGRGRKSYFGEALRLARAARRWQYDLGIDPRGDFFATLVLWLAGIPRRLGWPCAGGAFLLTDVAPWDASRHEVESRRVLLEPLKVHSAGTQPELFPSWSDSYCVRELLSSVPNLRMPLIVIHVGAGTTAKRWPLSHWTEFVGRLDRESAGSIVFVGDAHDRPLGRALARVCPSALDCTGGLTLMQTAALLGEADLFIGADSGPAHIAAAMGTPSVVLFSGTNRAETWRPVGTEVHVLRQAVPCSPCHLKECPVAGHPCMARITPAEVFSDVQQFIKATANRRSPQLAKCVNDTQ